MDRQNRYRSRTRSCTHLEMRRGGSVLLALALLIQRAAGSAEECEPCAECAGCVDCFDDERCGPCAGCEPCYTADGGVNTTVETCAVCVGCEVCSRCGSCDEYGCREQCAGCACYWRVKRCQREPCVSCSKACTDNASTPGCDPGCASCGDCTNCYDCHDCTCCTGCKFCIDAGYAPCPSECVPYMTIPVSPLTCSSLKHPSNSPGLAPLGFPFLLESLPPTPGQRH